MSTPAETGDGDDEAAACAGMTEEAANAAREAADQLQTNAQQLLKLLAEGGGFGLGDAQTKHEQALKGSLTAVLLELDALTVCMRAVGVKSEEIAEVMDEDDLEREEAEQLGPDTYQTTAYQLPQRARARAAAAAARFMQGRMNPFSVSSEMLGKMGVGVELYFRLLSYLAVVFTVMSLIAVPALSLNSESHGVPAEDVDSLSLVKYTLGNQGLHPDNIESLGGCLPEGKVDCNGTYINSTFADTALGASYMISFCDFGYSWFFVLFIVVLSWKVGDIVQSNDDKNVTPADYAVLVRGLPPRATETQILRYFSNRYDLTKPHAPWVFPWAPWKAAFQVGAVADAGAAFDAITKAEAKKNKKPAKKKKEAKAKEQEGAGNEAETETAGNPDGAETAGNPDAADGGESAKEAKEAPADDAAEADDAGAAAGTVARS